MFKYEGFKANENKFKKIFGSNCFLFTSLRTFFITNNTYQERWRDWPDETLAAYTLRTRC